MKITISTEKPGPLEIHKLLQQYANSQWMADHLTDEKAVEFVVLFRDGRGTRQ
jgi:hypothetical protein